MQLRMGIQPAPALPRRAQTLRNRWLPTPHRAVGWGDAGPKSASLIGSRIAPELGGNPLYAAVFYKRDGAEHGLGPYAKLYDLSDAAYAACLAPQPLQELQADNTGGGAGRAYPLHACFHSVY